MNVSYTTGIDMYIDQNVEGSQPFLLVLNASVLYVYIFALEVWKIEYSKMNGPKS